VNIRWIGTNWVATLSANDWCTSSPPVVVNVSLPPELIHEEIDAADALCQPFLPEFGGLLREISTQPGAILIQVGIAAGGTRAKAVVLADDVSKF